MAYTKRLGGTKPEPTKKKDVKSGMVDHSAFNEGGEPYNISVKKGSPLDLLGIKLGSIPNNLRPGKWNTKSRDPFLSGLSSADRKARSLRNNDQEIAERKAGTY